MPWDRNMDQILAELATDPTPLVLRALEVTGSDVAAVAAEDSPVDTGLYSASWESRTTGPLQVTTTNRAPYAHFVRFDRTRIRRAVARGMDRVRGAIIFEARARRI